MTRDFMKRHFCVLLMASSVEASVHLKVDPDKRISVPISFDSMNRIAFAHDRIAQVFGDEAAYTMQSDEAQGQLFLKPTEENGDKPISITVTTEQGVIQDMELIPQKIPTRTVILKDADKKAAENHDKKSVNGFSVSPEPYRGLSSVNGSHHAFGDHRLEGADYATQLVQLIKFAARQTHIPVTGDEEIPVPIKIDHLEVSGVKVIRQNGLMVSVYKVTNATDQTIDISENDFIGRHVLSMSCEKQSLPPKETSFLYLVHSV